MRFVFWKKKKTNQLICEPYLRAEKCVQKHVCTISLCFRIHFGFYIIHHIIILYFCVYNITYILSVSSWNNSLVFCLSFFFFDPYKKTFFFYCCITVVVVTKKYWYIINTWILFKWWIFFLFFVSYLFSVVINKMQIT